MDSTDYFSVNEFDIDEGTDSLLGVIYEPGAIGLIVDAIGFNANEGILYYVGFNDGPGLYLYAIPVRDDSLWNFAGNFVVEIDYVTGEVITRAELTEFIGFVPGNVSEIACDNIIFALNNYILTGTKGSG
jgi:hypothetical protein